MFPFNISAKKNLSPANFHLNLGKSPPQNKKSKSISPKNLLHHNGSLKKAYSISISPQNLLDHNGSLKKAYSISPQNLLHHNGALKKAYSISPQKRRETNKPFTSHDIRQSINDYYTQKTYNKPTKLNLINKLSTFTNNLKKTLFTKNKPVSLNLGQSPPRNNIGISIGGKITTKPFKHKKLIK